MNNKSLFEQRHRIYEAWKRHNSASKAALELGLHRTTVLQWVQRVKHEIAGGHVPSRDAEGYATETAATVQRQPEKVFENQIEPAEIQTAPAIGDRAARIEALRLELAQLESRAEAHPATRQTDDQAGNESGTAQPGGKADALSFVSERTLPNVAPSIIGSETVQTDGIYRVIVTPDAQVPYEDPIAMHAVEKYVADNRFDEWVDLGDFLDLDFLSRHNEGKHRLNAGKMLKEHYAYGREIIDRRLRILRANNPDAKMTMIEGNHEFRVEAFIDRNPGLEGMIEVAEGLGLAERNVQWIRFWRDGTLYRIGKALFMHGRYTSRYHAAKTAETYCDNVFYGHTHDVMEFPKVMHGRDKVIVGQSLGCLCRYDQSYIKENPSNWQQAFAEFHFFPNGQFTYYVPRIIGGKFVAPNGQIYSGYKGGEE